MPQGHGVLGIPIEAGQGIRLTNVADDPRSKGFPAHHPHMHSFMGVPIVSKGKIFGHLYLTDKLPNRSKFYVPRAPGGVETFTQQDQEILEMFATEVAIAIENAKLYHENQKIAVFQERERFGMDLHDGVIQSIYAIGLVLEDAQHRLTEEPNVARQRIQEAIQGLNTVIKDIRNYIHDLRSQQFMGHSLQRGLEELALEVEAFTNLKINLQLDSDALARVSPRQTGEFLHIAREALTNIRKHAHATQVRIRLAKISDQIKLEIVDNGAGFSFEETMDSTAGNGLRNMRERVHMLDGKMTITSDGDEGTTIVATVPIP